MPVPWRGRALFGTWESSRPASYEEQPGARREEVRAFIDEINQAFQEVELILDDVTLVHRGLVSGVAGPVAL